MTDWTVDDLVYVGFASRVVALDRQSGEVVWDWKSPEGHGYVAVLVDGDCLMVSVMGYTYCLDGGTGELLWSNPLKGYGVGVPCIATVRGSTDSGAAAQAAADQQNASAGVTTFPATPTM